MVRHPTQPDGRAEHRAYKRGLSFGSTALAATVSIAIVVASGIATTIGLLLPWIFAKLGSDPALGSGPVATVVQDVLSLLIYFLIASVLVF